MSVRSVLAFTEILSKIEIRSKGRRQGRKKVRRTDSCRWKGGCFGWLVGCLIVNDGRKESIGVCDEPSVSI